MALKSLYASSMGSMIEIILSKKSITPPKNTSSRYQVIKKIKETSMFSAMHSETLNNYKLVNAIFLS
jgi:hypothetical protein